jgi:ubiquinone/menaquinone biosynthesis C-methylase UbiE
MLPDSISRFSRPVENYIRYRPTYPQAVVEFLQETCQLTSTATIADIGSGTGLLSEVLLRNGYRVIGVEPNSDMQLASQQFLQTYPRFTSVAATAEETTLDPHSIDLITAGQAFDWFEPTKTRQEFERILKPIGWVALIWNITRTDTPFLAAYDQLWHKYIDFQSHVRMGTQDNKIQAFYSPGSVKVKTFNNAQVVDYEGLKGRSLSSSFAPTPDRSEYAPMLKELEAIFQQYQIDGHVAIEYECRLCYGQFH